MKKGNTICPKCGSKDAEYGESEEDCHTAYLLCHACGYETEETSY